MNKVESLMKDIDAIPMHNLTLNSKFVMIAHKRKLTIGDYGSKVGLVNAIVEMMKRDKPFRGLVIKCVQIDLKLSKDVDLLMDD